MAATDAAVTAAAVNAQPPIISPVPDKNLDTGDIELDIQVKELSFDKVCGMGSPPCLHVPPAPRILSARTVAGCCCRHGVTRHPQDAPWLPEIPEEDPPITTYDAVRKKMWLIFEEPETSKMSFLVNVYVSVSPPLGLSSRRVELGSTLCQHLCGTLTDGAP